MMMTLHSAARGARIGEAGAEGIKLMDGRVGPASGAADDVRAGGLGLLEQGVERGEEVLGDVDLVGGGGRILDAAGDDESLLGARGDVCSSLEDATIPCDGGIRPCGELIESRVEPSMGGAQLKDGVGLDGLDLMIGGTELLGRGRADGLRVDWDRISRAGE